MAITLLKIKIYWCFKKYVCLEKCHIFLRICLKSQISLNKRHAKINAFTVDMKQQRLMSFLHCPAYRYHDITRNLEHLRSGNYCKPVNSLKQSSQISQMTAYFYQMRPFTDNKLSKMNQIPFYIRSKAYNHQ